MIDLDAVLVRANRLSTPTIEEDGHRCGISCLRQPFSCASIRQRAELYELCNTDVPAMVERIRELEAAVLETSRHLFGKCDCRTKHPGAYTEVACADLAEKPLIPLIETGPSPEYEHRLRRSE